jgi:lipoprotein-anchoring transpeptidase ErfK/SrfK
MGMLVPATAAGAQAPPPVEPVPPATPIQPVAGTPGGQPRPVESQAGPLTPTAGVHNPPTTPRKINLVGGAPPNSGAGRRIVYSNSGQRVWLVEANGEVVKTHRVSGRLGIPRPGTYAVYSKSLNTYSMLNPSIRWSYMVRFVRTASGNNIGFHEIPTGPRGRLQTEAQLGQPLSSGCVRQATPDAIFLYHWAPVGTPVVVLP